MGEVERYPVLGRSDNLPNAVLVHRVEVWEGRAVDGAIGVVYSPPTRICQFKLFLMLGLGRKNT